MNIIECKNLTRNFGAGESLVHALNNVSFNTKKGAFVVILGRSGSGKSTLLNQFCGLDKPTSGELNVNGKTVSNLHLKELAKYRGSIGIIFQSYNLLPNLNTVENILMGSWAASNKKTERDAEKLMDFLDIKHRKNTNIKTLSGGEKQRVAIARSLINDPEIIFCDEPTGALDSENEAKVIQILLDLNRAGKTIVMVTHNPDFTRYASQIIRMQDGRVIENVEKEDSYFNNDRRETPDQIHSQNLEQNGHQNYSQNQSQNQSQNYPEHHSYNFEQNHFKDRSKNHSSSNHQI